MLRKLRDKKTSKKIWIVLAILIVPAFILWGSGSLMRSKQEASYAGKIFGRKISLIEYKDALEAVKNQAIIQFGDNLSEIQKKINLESEAWDRLLLLAEARKRKIKVSDREVVELIQSYPFFKRKEQFDNQLYAELLQYAFHTQPRIFEEQTRQNLMLSKLYKEITAGLKLNEEEIKEEYRKLNEQISLYYIAGNPADFAKDITASAEKIKDYFQKNTLEFKQPLSFNIEYVSLAADDKSNEETIKDRIKKLALRLGKTGSFNNAAADFGLEVKETGLFTQNDPIPGIGWSPQVMDMIAKLKTGGFSPPIRIDKYYYILRLKEKKESYVPDFETIKDKVRERFIKDASSEVARGKIENCLKKLKEQYQNKPKSVDFDKTARIHSLKSGSTSLFKYGSYIEGIGASDDFFIEAQKLKDNEFSGIIDTPSGFYIVKLKSVLPVDEKKFAEEKTEFAERLLLQKKVEYFGKFIEELKKKAQLF